MVLKLLRPGMLGISTEERPLVVGLVVRGSLGIEPPFLGPWRWASVGYSGLYCAASTPTRCDEKGLKIPSDSCHELSLAGVPRDLSRSCCCLFLNGPLRLGNLQGCTVFINFTLGALRRSQTSQNIPQQFAPMSWRLIAS